MTRQRKAPKSVSQEGDDLIEPFAGRSLKNTSQTLEIVFHDAATVLSIAYLLKTEDKQM